MIVGVIKAQPVHQLISAARLESIHLLTKVRIVEVAKLARVHSTAPATEAFVGVRKIVITVAEVQAKLVASHPV